MPTPLMVDAGLEVLWAYSPESDSSSEAVIEIFRAMWRELHRSESRMDIHKNARLTPAGREAMVRRVVEGGQTPKALSAAVGVCPRTVRKWVGRFRAEG